MRCNERTNANCANHFEFAFLFSFCFFTDWFLLGFGWPLLLEAALFSWICSWPFRIYRHISPTTTYHWLKVHRTDLTLFFGLHKEECYGRFLISSLAPLPYFGRLFSWHKLQITSGLRGKFATMRNQKSSANQFTTRNNFTAYGSGTNCMWKKFHQTANVITKNFNHKSDIILSLWLKIYEKKIIKWSEICLTSHYHSETNDKLFVIFNNNIRISADTSAALIVKTTAINKVRTKYINSSDDYSEKKFLLLW